MTLSLFPDQLHADLHALSNEAHEAIIQYGERFARYHRYGGDPGSVRLHATSQTRGALCRRGLVSHPRALPVLTDRGWQAFARLVEIESPTYEWAQEKAGVAQGEQ